MNIFGRKGKKDAAAAKAAAAVTKELCQVLGVPLKQAVRNNPSFDGVPVPAVVRECLDYVGLYGLQLEGIYRVSSPKSRLDELEEMANSGRQHEIIFQDAHEAAGLLKRFLRQLPEHILTPQLNNQFNETAKLCKCDPMGPCTCPVALQVKELLLKLPTENFHLLGYVFRHAQLVIQQESRNKMGLAALGVLLQAMLSLDRAVLKMFIMNAGSLADSTGKCTPLFDGVHTKTLDCRYAHSPVCASQPDIIYAWAHDAPKLILPEGVAFRVGGSTKAKHLILQVHYMHKMEGEDQSGVRVLHTEEPQPRTAATLLLATDGQMAPKKTEQLEVACVVDEPVELHPFAFRVHTHRHGTNVGGWLVQEDPISGEDHWTLLGQRDPQLPQLFQPLANQSLTITQGDILAARCHIRNDEGRTIKIGPTGEDEMCNFYLMYWTDGDTLEQNACFSPGPPEYKWTTGAGLNHTPKRK